MIQYFSAEHTLSHLLMSPITSPDNHSPMNPAPSGEIDLSDNESECKIGDVEDTNSDVFMVF